MSHSTARDFMPLSEDEELKTLRPKRLRERDTVLSADDVTNVSESGFDMRPPIEPPPESTAEGTIEPGSERWLRQQSIAADESANWNVPIMYIVMTFMTGKIADMLVTQQFLPLTNHYILLFGSAVEAALIIQILRIGIEYLFLGPDAEVAAVDPSRRMRLGTWLHSILLLLGFLFFVSFFVAFNVFLVMVNALFSVANANFYPAFFAFVLLLLHGIYFAAHPSIGLVAHMTKALSSSLLMLHRKN
jgi:hypothetical protein